jgi:hypothetical protein
MPRRVFFIRIDSGAPRKSERAGGITAWQLPHAAIMQALFHAAGHLNRLGMVAGLAAALGFASACSSAHDQSDPSAADGGMNDAACKMVVASDYDQSCDADSDCVAVGEVTACGQTCGCPSAAVNVGAAAAYMVTFERLLSPPNGGGCDCGCDLGPACQHGLCVEVSCAAQSQDRLPACTDAGGYCELSLDGGCPQPFSFTGRAGACAYSDEICCTR